MPKKAIKPRKQLVPRTRAGGEWTEAKFWGWLRGVLRAGARRWPPIVRQSLTAVRRPYQGDNPRMKWEYQCCKCQGWFCRKEVEVHHVVECGSLKSFSDLGGFAERMFCEADGLVVLCDSCHSKEHRGENE
jgi:hypothetical protein